MRRIVSVLLMLAALISRGSLPVSAGTDRPPALRALLIGCDAFLSQEDTWPAAENSVNQMADTLLSDQRGYALIRCLNGSVSSIKMLEEAIWGVFQNAEENDISLLYVSTHGIVLDGEDGLSYALLFSDGKAECAVEAAELQRILDRVPGKKVLIFDACNSGGLIGKGIRDRRGSVFFSGRDYKVLCSAGGSEASWYWQGNDTGASYFSQALTAGLGGHGADVNRDGEITLSEAYAYLLDSCAVSTPHAYPQQDDGFVLYAYDESRPDAARQSITDLTFDDTLLTAGESEVRFSFTVQQQTELYYQIVYQQNGVWQFHSAQQFLDGEQADGTVLPGRKTRSLILNTGEADESGYAMIQLITRENGRTIYQGSRLLCVRPVRGGINLSVSAEGAFAPFLGQELMIAAVHDVPCGLTVRIVNGQGTTVRYLAYDVPSRPEQLTPSASTFYWDGQNASGEIAPAGAYRAVVSTRIGRQTFTAESEPFYLVQ